MRIITINCVALGMAAALTFGTVGTAGAQVTTDSTRTVTRSKTTVTSTRRIPVRKDGSGVTTTESSGSLAPNADSLRADSIAQADRMRQESIANAERMRQDSIANVERMRQDSIAAEERARQEALAAERARQEALARAEADRIRELSKGDVYFRLGAGVSMPKGAFGDAYKQGFNVTGSAGWHKWSSPIGVRFDVGYDRFGVKSAVAGFSDNANIWSGLGEVTLKIPNVLAVSPYLVAGGGLYRLSGSGAGSSSETKGGWNAGGGITFGVAQAKLFLETRYMNVSTPGEATKFMPVILGFQF